jgi:hypothetical protein
LEHLQQILSPDDILTDEELDIPKIFSSIDELINSGGPTDLPEGLEKKIKLIEDKIPEIEEQIREVNEDLFMDLEQKYEERLS